MEPGQTATTLSCMLRQFPKITPTADDEEAPTHSMLPEPEPSTGKATVPDNITDQGLCMWEVNDAKLRIQLTLAEPLVAAYEAPPVPKFTLNELLPKVCAPLPRRMRSASCCRCSSASPSLRPSRWRCLRSASYRLPASPAACLPASSRLGAV